MEGTSRIWERCSLIRLASVLHWATYSASLKRCSSRDTAFSARFFTCCFFLLFFFLLFANIYTAFIAVLYANKTIPTIVIRISNFDTTNITVFTHSIPPLAFCLPRFVHFPEPLSSTPSPRFCPSICLPFCLPFCPYCFTISANSRLFLRIC